MVYSLKNYKDATHNRNALIQCGSIPLADNFFLKNKKNKEERSNKWWGVASNSHFERMRSRMKSELRVASNFQLILATGKLEKVKRLKSELVRGKTRNLYINIRCISYYRLSRYECTCITKFLFKDFKLKINTVKLLNIN